MSRSLASPGLACALALGAGMGPAPELQGQTGAPPAAVLAEALADDRVAGALDRIEQGRDATAEFLVQIGGIISPSGEEQERAEAVAARMREIGLDSVRITDAPNAIGVIPGRSGRALVFVSTLDDLATVAEHQRAAGTPPRVEGDRVVGPGTNTSLTTAAILAAAEAWLSTGLRPEHDLVFAAVAEEETGLHGMKALYEQYRDRADAFVDVLGDGQSISYGALGIHWWRVNAEGPAGHTLNGGLPNINQAMGRAIDRILSLPAASSTDDTRTRLNIAMVQSGAVFNHKPSEGWFSLDIRSMEAAIIAGIEAEVESILADVSEETGIALRMEPFQLTPGGQIAGALESPLVQTSREISRHLGFDPSLSDSGSANLNVAIAAGTPAIGLGGSRGGDRGLPTEWADIDVMMRTAQHVLLLAVTLGG
ncbi:M20/M25/M40 family metallo-hydrolase [Gaopeijia maritima]|uniref:M20/M25/M40 family metallo-hydrolase n=1 Tax=Gaopeijia maritima TaxID=3119007 RepID=UPI003245D3B5